MKKLMICICFCMVLAGCGMQNNVTSETSSVEPIVTEKETILKDEPKATEQVQKTKEALRIAIEGKEIILKNLIEDEIVKTYKLNKKQCANSVKEMGNGYCVRVIEANRELKDSLVDGFTIYDTPDESEIVNVSIKFFDKGLNEIDSIDISKLAEEKKCEDLLVTNFTVSRDGTLLAWDIDESILCYNRKTKEFSKYKQIYEKDIVADSIAFVGDDILAFCGTQGDMEEDTCYGYLDFSNKKLFSFIEKKFEAFSLNVDKRYMWLNDGENPEDGTASGKFIMVDTETGKNNIISVDNIESTKARITEEGKDIIAISQTEEKSFRVRQYSVEEGKVLNEKMFKYSESVHANDIVSIGNGRYAVIYGTDKGEKLEEIKLK